MFVSDSRSRKQFCLGSEYLPIRVKFGDLMKLLFFILFILVSHNSYGSEFKLQKLQDKNSVCNDGKSANYWVANQNSDRWLIHLPGGGGAWDEKTFISRDKNKKESISKPNSYSKSISSLSAVGSMLFDKGYNILLVHYCSSDLYAGNHFNKINGESIPFKGRKIIEEILSIHQKDLISSTDTIIAGQSAGVYGVILNLDLFSNLPNSRFIMDAAWRDSYQQSLKKPKDGWVSFTLGDMPEHCDGDFYKNCNVTIDTLKRFNADNSFIIFNYGDPFNWAKSDEQKVPFFKSIENDMKSLSGGFSVDAKKYKLKGAIKWGHGLLGQKKYFNHKINGVSLSTVINDWIEGEDNPIFISY
jgi:hypothetical protein